MSYGKEMRKKIHMKKQKFFKGNKLELKFTFSLSLTQAMMTLILSLLSGNKIYVNHLRLREKERKIGRNKPLISFMIF